jgi:hypothetical protein
VVIVGRKNGQFKGHFVFLSRKENGIVKKEGPFLGDNNEKWNCEKRWPF